MAAYTSSAEVDFSDKQKVCQMTTTNTIVDSGRAERVEAVRAKIAAFKATPAARAMWQDWAVERFRLATEWEINHLGQFAVFSVDGDGFKCRGMSPAGWEKLIEFTDQARKEGRKIAALSRQENNLTAKQEERLTSSTELDILNVPSKQVA